MYNSVSYLQFLVFLPIYKMLSSLVIPSQALISNSLVAAEQVLNLFDHYWFETTIFSPYNSSLDTISETKVEVHPHPAPNLLRISTLEVRSFGDQNLGCMTSFSPDFSSPESVLFSPKLKTILSGKEVGVSNTENHEIEEVPFRKKPMHSHRRRPRRGKTSSKSLSELEFEELKWFMDLGFVFSEEDKDSKLVSLVPGLQRLESEEEGKIDETVISRPYLSEAWEVLDQRKVGNSLMNWKVPAPGNEIDMKDNLRFWAHTVASIVR